MRYYLARRLDPKMVPSIAVYREDGKSIVVDGASEHRVFHLGISDFFAEDLTEIHLFAWDPSEVSEAFVRVYPVYLRPKFVPIFITSLEQTWRDLGQPKLPVVADPDVSSRAKWAADVHAHLELMVDSLHAPLFAQALRRRINRAAERAEDKTREQCVTIVTDHLYKTLDSGASVSRADIHAIAEKIIRSTLS